MIVLSLIITFLLFGIYGWTSAVECGISFLRLLPSSTFTKQGLRLFRPMWEVTNVFLLLGITAFVAFFSSGRKAVFHRVVISLIAGLIAIVVRSGLVLWLYYTKQRTGLRWQNLLFSIASFAVPISFGTTGVTLITGMAFWRSTAGWVMVTSLSLGLLALGVSFVYYVVGQTPHDRLHLVSRWLNVGLSAIVAIGLQLAVIQRTTRLQEAPFSLFIGFAAFGLLVQAGLWLGARERYMWWYFSLFAVVTPLLLGLANRPYLLYSSVKVHDAYGATLTVVLGVVLVAILAGFGFFARLVSRKRARR
jgi:cytochrome bd-type quinol oxidase subunit 2